MARFIVNPDSAARARSVKGYIRGVLTTGWVSLNNRFVEHGQENETSTFEITDIKEETNGHCLFLVNLRK